MLTEVKKQNNGAGLFMYLAELMFPGLIFPQDNGSEA